MLLEKNASASLMWRTVAFEKVDARILLPFVRSLFKDALYLAC